jgi:hypothetical protein
LFRFKEDKDFNRRHTLSISRINPPKFGGGLKSESDPRGIGYAFHGAGVEIEQKGAFCKGLRDYEGGTPWVMRNAGRHA